MSFGFWAIPIIPRASGAHHTVMWCARSCTLPKFHAGTITSRVSRTKLDGRRRGSLPFLLLASSLRVSRSSVAGKLTSSVFLHSSGLTNRLTGPSVPYGSGSTAPFAERSTSLAQLPAHGVCPACYRGCCRADSSRRAVGSSTVLVSVVPGRVHSCDI